MRLGLVAISLCALAATARADSPNPKRKIAVIDFRTGSAALADIGSRAAVVLDKLTSLDILGQDGARTSFGADLDHAVVKCAGDAICVAEIGKKLGVDEVILVGVAEFGDVILTLQRIDASSGAVISRVAEAMAAGQTVSDGAIESYLRRVLPKGDFLRYGVIRITANIDGAQVSVGGKARGETPLQPLRLQAPATYPIVVAKSGYTEFRASVAVPPDAEVRVRSQLVRQGSRDVWYKKWWVLALVGTVAAGAVTTAVIVARDDASDVGVSGNF